MLWDATEDADWRDLRSGEYRAGYVFATRPHKLLPADDGNIYGATLEGGNNSATVKPLWRHAECRRQRWKACSS